MNGMYGSSLEKARQATIKCITILEGQFSGEVVVTVETIGGLLTGVFPSSYIDMTRGTVTVFVVAEKPDKYLIDLPAQTVTSGSKAWFLKDAVSLQPA